jgi:radical SAM protein with 4Fe4S-binding SPASM domain
LEWGERFDWPSLVHAPDYGERGTCYGLRDQIGVLSDGTVVPCCLDGEGTVALGNLHRTDMETILNEPRTQAMLTGFHQGRLTEPLCRHCGYARRFTKK